MTGRIGAVIAGLAACAALTPGVAAAAQQQAEAGNMALVGHHDLQGRGAYQPVVHRQGERWIAYIGHHGDSRTNELTGKPEPSGTSLLDVTDPKQPRLLAHIPGEPGGGAQMVRVCNGADLPRADRSKVFLLRPYGNAAHEIWDVTEPARPRIVSTVAKGLHGTHKNWWECDTGIAYLVSGVPGWRTHRMAQVYDLGNPAKPVFIRNFGLPGQQPGASGPVPTELHGPISTGPRGNRVYFGYGTNRSGVLQIVDREKLLKGPREPSSENLLYPQVGRLDLPPGMGAHTTFPLIGVPLAEFAKDAAGGVRDFVLVVNEALAGGCREQRQMVWFVDVTAESRPFGVSNWTVPEASGNFCRREGRFGAHSSHESFTPVYYKRIAFIAWFNAGVRALDIRDPLNPKEIGYYIPPAAYTNNVEVDDRGLVYIVDRVGGGMHILELTGPARAIANLPK